MPSIKYVGTVVNCPNCKTDLIFFYIEKYCETFYACPLCRMAYLPEDYIKLPSIEQLKKIVKSKKTATILHKKLMKQTISNKKLPIIINSNKRYQKAFRGVPKF